MDIQAEKLELIEMLLHTEKESVIDKIKAIFRSENKDGQSMLSEEQWAIVAEERARYFRGEGENYSLEEVKKMIKKN